MFNAIEDQHEIVRGAMTQTRRMRRANPTNQEGRRTRSATHEIPIWDSPPPDVDEATSDVDYTEPALPYPVEIW